MLVVNDKFTKGWVDCLRTIDKKYPYRKECFYKALSTFEYNKFVELQKAFEDYEVSHIPSYVNLLAPGFCIYLGHYLSTYGTSKINIYDYDKEVTELNGILLWNYEMEHRLTALDIIFDQEHIDTKHIDTVINQSCENMWHMKSLLNSYRDDTVFAFQSTSENGRGRINVHSSLDEFVESTGLKSVIYTNEANNIFTVIGRQ